MRKSKFQMLRSGFSVLALSALLIIGMTGCSNSSGGSNDATPAAQEGTETPAEETPETPAEETPETPGTTGTSQTPATTVTYTVTFNSNGGEAVTSQKVEKGKFATKPTDPTKQNKRFYSYTFSDWYSDSSLTTVFNFATPITADITLYAKWTETFIGLTEDQVSRDFIGTTYHVLESGTDGTAGTNGTYVLFGDWPQSAKDEDVIVYETISVTQGAFTYYKGCDNCWYLKEYDSYFKVEPITWRVLSCSQSNGKTQYLFLAENILTTSAFYTSIDPSSYHNGTSNEREIDDKTVYPNNYKHSLIRAYLNGLSYEKKDTVSNQQIEDGSYEGLGFLQTAFTNDLQSNIAETNVDNSSASTYPASETVKDNNYICENTNDKIFLLSAQEITDSNYAFEAFDQGGAGNSRKRTLTDYVKAIGGSEDHLVWLLRSPANADDTEIYISKDCCTKIVSDDGKVTDIREVLGVSGVVPALYYQQ